MILFVSGQISGQNNQFSETELDGVYIGMRQANHYKEKLKDMQEIVKQYDSLTIDMSQRINTSILREEQLMGLVEQTQKGWDIEKIIGKNNVTIQKKKSNKKLLWIIPSSVFLGGIIGVAASN